MARTLKLEIAPKLGAFVGFRYAYAKPLHDLGGFEGDGGSKTLEIPDDPTVLRVDANGLGSGSYLAVFTLEAEGHEYKITRAMTNGADGFTIKV